MQEGRSADRSKTMQKYTVTITTLSKDKTYSSVVLRMAANGFTASYPKESGIEITPLSDGLCNEFLFRLPHTNEEFRLCLETRRMGVPPSEYQFAGSSKKSKENYLM
jgi:hypothetical protein